MRHRPFDEDAEKLLLVLELRDVLFAMPSSNLTVGEIWFAHHQTYGPKFPEAPSLDERKAELERLIEKAGEPTTSTVTS